MCTDSPCQPGAGATNPKLFAKPTEITMKKLTLLASLIVTSSWALAGETTVHENDITALVPHCASQVASVSVGKFNCKASGCQKREPAANMGGIGVFMAMAAAKEGLVSVDFSGIGDGMAYALTTALKATGCFDVQEREAMEELQKEAALSGIKIEVKPADFLLTGAITSVGMETAKTSIGGGMIPVVGGFSKTTKNANLAMDIRVVEVRKANVKASKSFNSNDQTSSWGLAGGGLVGGGALFGGHSVTKSPEMDKLAAQTVLYATSYLVDTLAANAVVSRPVLKPEPKAESKPAQNGEGSSEGSFSLL
jgi:curli biogenesis system outer membrane secretion channel CsgG